MRPRKKKKTQGDVDVSALRAEIDRLRNELQDALDRNREIQQLTMSELEDIARMAVALVRARAAQGEDE